MHRGQNICSQFCFLEVKLKAAKLDVSEEDIHGIIDSNQLKEEYHAIVENLKHEYIHNLALRSSTGNIIGPGKDFLE